MPTVLLVRHAQASFGASEYDALSPRGVEQAVMLSAELERRGTRIARVVSGTLERQRGTAGPLAAQGGVAVDIDSRWDEYAADDILTHYTESSARLEHSSGEVPTLTPAQFQDLLENALRAWVHAGEAALTGESWPGFYARANAALDDLAGDLGRGETAVVCTSGGVLAAICVRLLRVPEPAFLEFNRVAANTGVTKIICGSRGTSLISFNEHGHLERPDGSYVTYR